jgi:cell division protein FtsI/penicillin-binding protein 2
VLSAPEGKTIAPAEPQVVPAEKGRDVQLTIDRSLQYDTERILGDQVRAAGAKSGIAVVMKPDTGEVLSMANVVSDPKTGEVSVDGNNAAMTTSYEPGSVMKMITASGALENGKVQPDTVVPIPDTMQICDSQFSEHDYHGNVGWPVSKILAVVEHRDDQARQMIGKTRSTGTYGVRHRAEDRVGFPNGSRQLLRPTVVVLLNGSIPIGQASPSPAADADA